MVILDACRNNPFERAFRSQSRGLAFTDAPRGTLIAYATSPGSVAADGKGRNGTYTEALLKHMKTPGIRVETMFKRVRADVERATRNAQTPWESSSLTGEFYFTLPERVASSEVVCPKGTRMEGGRCVAAVECPKGMVFQGGRCVKAAAPRATRAPSRAGMVKVPGGIYTMGADDGADDEKPARQMHVDTFWIDAHEVTVDAYAACVKAGACTEPTTEPSQEGYNWGRADRASHPVNGVSWLQAASYCAWVGKRLPMEAEWEKAARGAEARPYPWGAEKPSCERAVMDDPRSGVAGCGRSSTWPVGSKPAGASPYGVHDMAGNVWEWANDWYDPAYYARPPHKSRIEGPKDGAERVIRGGSYALYAGYMRAVGRGHADPSKAGPAIGFRCVATFP